MAFIKECWLNGGTNSRSTTYLCILQGRTPLHYAAACSRVDVTAVLLDYGADATHRDNMSKTPLHYAREKKLDYVVALLTCHGNAVADFVRMSR